MVDSKSLLDLSGSSAGSRSASPMSINEEAGLGPEWKPVDRPPIIPGVAAPQAGDDGASRYLTGSLPPGYQHDTSFVGTSFRGSNTPRLDLMPLGINGNPATNAAIMSTARLAGAPGSPGTTVDLIMPTEFAVREATSGGKETITVTWEPEATGTVFAGPPGDAVGFDVSFTGAGQGDQPVIGGIAAITAGQPSAEGEWALYTSNIVGGSGYSTTPASPWVIANGSSVTYPVYTQVIPAGATTVPVTQDFAGYSAWAGSICYFGGSVPTFVQAVTSSFDGTGLCTLTFGAALTAGNAVLVIVNPALVVGSTTPVTVSDTQGLTPIELSSAASGINPIIAEGAQSTLFIMFDAANAAETINVQINSGGGANGGSVTAIEITPLTPVPARPRFRILPAPNLANVTGILGVGNGGTGANLAATGGASKVLKQVTAGAAITVGQLAAVDLSNGVFGSGGVILGAGIIGTGTKAFFATTVTGTGTVGVLNASPTITGTAGLPIVTQTGKTTNYNGIATVSNGVPSELAQINTTGLTANVGVATLYPVPASGAGMYRISAYVVLTTAGSVSSTLPNVQIVYTDVDSNTSVTIDATPVLGAAGLGQTGLLTANTIGTAASGVIVINVKLSTTIQYQTVNYASTAAGMAYALHIRLEAL